jgi:hypothetical protein
MTGFLKRDVDLSNLSQAKLTPKSFYDVAAQNFNNHMNWHHTVGAALNEYKIADDFLSDFQTLFPEAKIRHPMEYASFGRDTEEDIQNWISFQQSMNSNVPINEAYNNSYKDNQVINPLQLPEDLPYEKKLEFMNREVQNFIGNLDRQDPRRKQFKDYQHYVDETLKRMQASEYKTALYSQYQKGNAVSKALAPMAGMSVAAFTDPAFIATLPLAAFSGGATWPAFLLREAAIGSAMGLFGQSLVESQILPFKERMGDENYTLKTSAANIGMVTIGGAVAGPIFGGVIRGTFGKTVIKDGKITFSTLETQLAKLSPKLRNKIIGREFKKKSAQLNPTETLNYILDNINKLQPHEHILLIEQIAPQILDKPQIKAAKQDIEIGKELHKETVYPNTREGKKVETINQLEAQKSLLTGEEMKVVETDLIPTVKETRTILRNQELAPDEIKVDAKTFQFKTDGDSLGVSQKLQDVKVWNPDMAQTVMVWQKADGTYFIADGHQRLGLAQRIKKNDPSQKITLNASVRREIDGWTAPEVMVEAMMVNVGAGTAKASDVAKILRVDPGYLNRVIGMLSERSSVIRDASDLIKLSDDAWGFWLNNKVPDHYAALVGRMVDDPALHLSVMQVLKESNPSSVVEASFYIREALQAGSKDVETLSLFGKETIKQTLLKERGLVLKKSLNELKQDKKVMATLVRNEQKIIEKGKNKLDTNYNKTQEQIYDQAIYAIEILATKKGPISDGLNAAARQWADGSKREAIETFKQVVRETIESGNYEGVSPSRSERIRPIEETQQQVSQKPNIIEDNIVLNQFDNPNNKLEFNKNADQDFESLRIESERDFSSKGNESSLAAETASVSTQEDFNLLKSTTDAPPSFVSARATAESFQSRTDPKMRIGDFNSIFDSQLYHVFDDIPTLIRLAENNIDNVRNTLVSISSKYKNATTEIRVKKQEKIIQNVSGKQDDFGKTYTAAYEPDILAGRIIVKQMADIEKIKNELRRDFKIVREKDMFEDPRTDTNYRAHHFQLITPDGLGFELQIHHATFLDAVKNKGKSKRFAEKYGGISKLNKEQRKIYDEYEAADKKLFQETYENILLNEIPKDEMLNVESVAVEGNLVNKEMTVKKFIDDVDNDKAIIERLRDCV